MECADSLVFPKQNGIQECFFCAKDALFPLNRDISFVAMRLLIYSDMHLENHSFTPPPAAVKQADVVILAGDIKEGGGLASARKMFPKTEIVYVAGNHEFYNTHWGRALARMRSEAKDLGIHFLENDELTLGGIRFLGCTLWTDFQFFGPRLEDLVKLECHRHLPDYHAIWVDDEKQNLADCNEFGFPPKRLIAPDDIQQRHRQSRAWLEAALAEGDPARTIVITHHLPHQRSVVHRYKQHRTSGGYASRLPAELIQRCGLWVHGHSHDSVNHRFGDSLHETRIISNPRGYRMLWQAGAENPRFDPGFTVEFPWPKRAVPTI